MSRINSNIPSIIAQRVLNTQNERLNKSLQRLSTGLKINTGKDDPAGLIASEAMRAEQRAIQAAQTNIARGSNVVSVAESGLSEIGSLLNDLEDLVDRSANATGISDDERSANQLEIDAILASVDRIASSTELQGRRLLSGELAYTTSGLDTTDVSHLRLNSARVPEGGSRTVAISVQAAASMAVLDYSGGTITGSARTIEVTGNLGTETVTFGSGTAASAIAAAVNNSKAMTGVSAAVVSNVVRFASVEYGSSQFVRVRSLTGASFATVGSKTEDYGADATVSINGSTATADGLNVSVRTTSLDADITLATAFGSTAGGTTTFSVTGGGAQFAVAPTLNLNSIATLGIDGVTTAALGDRDTGFLYSLGTGQTNSLSDSNFFAAQRIVRMAASQIAALRGRLGAFSKDTLDTTARSLAVQYENVSSAESSIRDADFAEETSNMTRSQILVQSATMVLKLANQAPQNVLSLLQ